MLLNSLNLLVYRLMFVLLSAFLSVADTRAEMPVNLSDTAVFFYNPETNINNYASLKVAFDTYFTQFGPVYFQPFSDRAMFEKAIAERQDGIFLLSGWHYRLLQKNFSIEPVLVGVFRGQSKQRKVLSAKKNISNVSLLKGLIIASSGSDAYTRTMLEQILGEKSGDILPQVKLMLVPKDLDALMAVGFGMADAALTTENSLESLAKINAKQYSLLTRLGASEKQFLTLAVVSKSAQKNTQALIELLAKIGEASSEGSSALRLLGLDAWRKLTPSERQELEP